MILAMLHVQTHHLITKIPAWISMLHVALDLHFIKCHLLFSPYF